MVRRQLALGAILLPLLVGTGAGTECTAGARMAAIAVFPVENLTGGGAPTTQVRRFLMDSLASEGIKVLNNEVLDDFMTRYRVRYAAGIDVPTAEALRRETGVDGVVIASMELASNIAPPKCALTVRLVSIADAPAVVWADDVGLAGDDRPGFFELGVVNDYQALLKTALERIGASLSAYMNGGTVQANPKAASKFRPKSSYRTVVMQPGTRYSVAVVPFFNLSARPNAGEILALLFARHLSSLPEFRVVEGGVTRRKLLDARIIMDGGLSVADAQTVAALSDADLVLGGRVLRYEDYDGPTGRTRVQFSTLLIERKSRKVVWSSDSSNDGADGVRFFERGTAKTAHAMATQMVGLTAAMIAGRSR